VTFISFIRSFLLIKQFISTLNIKLIAILLHYSYKKKTIQSMPNDTLNSKIVHVCEF